MTQQPTAAAMRAALRWTELHPEGLAQIIDTETHLPELIALAKRVSALGNGFGQITHITAEADQLLKQVEG